MAEGQVSHARGLVWRAAGWEPLYLCGGAFRLGELRNGQRGNIGTVFIPRTGLSAASFPGGDDRRFQHRRNYFKCRSRLP